MQNEICDFSSILNLDALVSKWDNSKKYLSAKRGGARPTPNYIHSDHFHVFPSNLPLNWSRRSLTKAYISAPLNCFDNNRRNECKQRANNIKSLVNSTSTYKVFYATPRTNLITPMGAIYRHKIALIDITERLRDFDGPARIVPYNTGDKVCICRNI